jgi:hypothetical protein
MSNDWKDVYRTISAINSRDQFWAGIAMVLLPAVALYGAYVAAVETAEEVAGPAWVAPAIFIFAAILLGGKYGWRFYTARTNSPSVLSGQVVYKPSRLRSMTGFNRRGSSVTIQIDVESARMLTEEGLGDDIPTRLGKQEVRCKKTIWSELPVGMNVDLVVLPHGVAAAYGIEGVFRRAPTLSDLFAKK